MVAYLIIIKDTVPVALRLEPPINQDTDTAKDFWTRELVMVITSLILCLPLSMMRDMASLSLTSLLSVTADTMLVGFVMGFAPVPSTVRDAGGIGQVLKDNWINSKLFIGLGVLSTAMACQHSAFIVAGSLQNSTSRRWQTVTNWSIGIAAVLCLVLGITGYLGFLNETQGDILNNFDAESLAANAGRTLLAITMFCTSSRIEIFICFVLCQSKFSLSLACESFIHSHIPHGSFRRPTRAGTIHLQRKFGK